MVRLVGFVTPKSYDSRSWTDSICPGVRGDREIQREDMMRFGGLQMAVGW